VTKLCRRLHQNPSQARYLLQVGSQFLGVLTMKIQPNNLQALSHAATRAKPNSSNESAASAISGSSTPAETASPESAAVGLAKSAGQVPKLLPPGLERVLERLQAAALAKPNTGQTNALASITRNIDRYQAVQSMGNTSGNLPPLTPGEPEATAVETTPASSKSEVGEGTQPAESAATEETQQPQAEAVV